LAADLAEWKLASGGRDSAPVFPRRDGKPWNLPTYLANWRRRVWNQVAPKGVTPYALRGSYASLLIHAGCSPVEVAAELGTASR
jgi:integrase